jgi:metal-responsive CopG/Arc/MetJ family transcriptional regulator
MIDRFNQKQMTVTMPKQLGEDVERVVSEHEEMSQAQFARQAMRRELQRYEIEGYGNE